MLNTVFNFELFDHLNTLALPTLVTVFILAVLLAPLVTRLHSRGRRIAQRLFWITVGMIIGLGLANFALLPLPLRGW